VASLVLVGLGFYFSWSTISTIMSWPRHFSPLDFASCCGHVNAVGSSRNNLAVAGLFASLAGTRICLPVCTMGVSFVCLRIPCCASRSFSMWHRFIDPVAALAINYSIHHSI